MSAREDSEEARLLRAFVERRDAASFRRLYRCTTPSIYAMAMHLCGAPAQAEELTQEAWCRAVAQIDTYHQRSAFRTWLMGILVNCHREDARKAARQATGLEPDALVTPLPVTPRAPADALDLERALAHLAPGYRKSVLLHDVFGYTHREISEMLAISEGTSKSQLQRARKRLRALLARGAGPAPAQGEGGTS